MNGENHINPVPRIAIQAFCELSDVAEIIQKSVSDRRMLKAHLKQNMGGAAAALEAYRNAQTPNVIVLETTHDTDFLISHLEALAEFCDVGTRVVVIGKANDIALYRKLIARGVSDYLVWPFSELDFIGAISRLFNTPGTKPLGRVISVSGAKGGVGASAIAHNLAWSLATETEMPTIIVDLDLGFGTAGLDFNQDPPQGVADVVFAPERVDATLIDRLLSKCGNNLYLLAAPAMLDRVYDFTEMAFDSLIDAMRASTPWIVLDVPHGWTGWTRRLLILADELIIVANPDLACLRNTKNLLDSLRTVRGNDVPPRIVLNNVGLPKRPEIAIPDFAKAVEMAPSIIIPHDAKVFGTAANNGQMIAEIDPKGKVAESFSSLVALMTNRPQIQKAKPNFWDQLFMKSSKKS